MLYFRMVWTENEYGQTFEMMQQCNEFSPGLVLQINEVKNPELVQELLSYPDQFYFTESLKLYKRDPGGDIPMSIATVEPPSSVTPIVTDNNVEITHDINTIDDDVSYYETIIYEAAPVETGALTGLPDPTVAPTLSQAADGNIPDGTYSVKYSFINNVGETLVSPVQSITITGGGGVASIAVTASPLPTGGRGIIVYASSDGVNFYLAGSADSNVCNIIEIPFDGVLPSSVNTTAGSAMKIADTTKSWAIDAWKGKAIKISAGAGAGQERVITENTATEITVDFLFDPMPDSSSQYEIRTFIKKSGLQTSWNFPGLQPNTSYYVKVRAYDRAGHYTDSPEAQITTGAAAPDVEPHGPTHSETGSDRITPAMIGAVNKAGDTMLGNLNLADNELQRPKIKDYSETIVIVLSSGATYTIDLTAGNIYDIILTENCTFVFANPPTSGAGSLTLILRQDATGSRTVTWPASVKWPNATAPTLSTAANAIDILTFFTIDGGTTWFGVLAGGGLG